MNETGTDTRKCPSCGMDNPKSQIKCPICGERMDKKAAVSKDVAKDIPKDETAITETPPPAPPKKTKPAPAPKKTAEGKKVSPAPDPEPKKVIKRRKRKSPTLPDEPIFFRLADGKIEAVTARLLISKPIKMSELPPMERAYIAFMNRNKELLTS